MRKDKVKEQTDLFWMRKDKVNEQTDQDEEEQGKGTD